MTQTTFDPSDTGGWHLSNGNLTATSPDNNTMQSIFTAFGNVAIPNHAKTYFEYRVSGAAIETAFNVGFGQHGFDPSNKDIRAEGVHVSNATFLAFAYNLDITNTGDVIYDPQGNAGYATRHPGTIASPNQWSDGSIVGVMVDRINNTVQFTLNGRSEGGAFDISGLGSKTVYPFVNSWYKPGPVATINGGTHGFAEGLPAGYTALDASGGGTIINPPPVGASNSYTVIRPSPLVAGNDTITGTEKNPSQPVYLAWRGSGTPSVGDSDSVRATVDSKGNFSAKVVVDHAGSQGTMFVGSSGAMTAEWSAVPVAASSGGGGPVVTPPPVSTGTVTIGSGSDTLALKVSEDAYLGNAQFTVAVDGKQIGGTQTATALHAAGQTQTFDVMGNFAAGHHTATVNYLNNLCAGTASTDRNLYVTGATIDNSVVSGATLSEVVNGPQSFSFMAPGSGSGSAPPPPASDSVTVYRPSNLAAAVQTISGMETDPSQSVFLDWRTSGTPAVGASDWVQAKVQSNGQFAASVTVDHPGTMSTMFYHTGSGPVVAAWSGTPT
jgi:hypothetical protein